MKTEIYNIIVRPLVTEKGTHQADANNAYSFEVNPKANKIQIKQAVQKLYGVRVISVRTANRKGKPRRVGRWMSNTKHWKKAMVELHPDDHIDLF
ncbi:MAG: 50S ribosomal protein L23 [Planctomycetota bacterium]